MTNLAISEVCNLTCPYCFASEYLGLRDTNSRFMTLPQYDELLDFLDRSGIDQVRLLGGEPTLHPHFDTLIQKAQARQKFVMIFSNGLMPSRALDALCQLSADQCRILVNVNSPHDIGDKAFARLTANLHRLGKRAIVGFNIYRADFDALFLLDLIAETDCMPHIRLGIAHRCLTDNNHYIHPRQYRLVAEKVLLLAQAAAQQDAAIEFDCGFVRCMFSDEEIQLLQSCGVTPEWHCAPILDVNLHGQAVACYPMAEYQTISVDKTITADLLHQKFSTNTAHLRQAGIYPECSTCHFKLTNHCPGGCLAATLQRFQKPSFHISMEETNHV